MSETVRRSKRPFQPSITSYFPRTEEHSWSLPRSGQPPRPSSPALPASVQSSLLNVGMRIRKSVPEGYKTKAVFHSSTKMTMRDSTPSRESGLVRVLGARELTPYCGIMKVGGYDNPQAICAPELEDLPSLEFDSVDGEWLQASSQESNDSISHGNLGTASPSNSHKRRLEDGKDGNCPSELVIYDEEEGWPSGQGWKAVEAAGMLNTNASRPLAQPKTRRKHHKSSLETAKDGQENWDSSVTQEKLDFEEAAFLQPHELVCHDVDMGGV